LSQNDKKETDVKYASFVKGIIGTDDILTDGVPEIAFVGRSNVGKSSVINSLVNRRNLVKVGKKPGKTTEINFFSINNKEVYFVDLPGYGYAKISPKQKDKIRKLILWYLMYSEAPIFKVVLILDVKVGLTDFDKEMLHVLREQGYPYLLVANKEDKINQKELAEQLRSIKEEAQEAVVFPYSALTRKKSDALFKEILEA
ncbi:GTP-binding protein EngB, partial [hydrothermal vent metagenome]